MKYFVLVASALWLSAMSVAACERDSDGEDSPSEVTVVIMTPPPARGEKPGEPREYWLVGQYDQGEFCGDVYAAAE